MDGDVSFGVPHPEIRKLRDKLRGVLHSISTFRPKVPKPPIIDASLTTNGEPTEEHQNQHLVHGLRTLRDAIKRDLENIEKFLADPHCARLPAPSTNAPYLISVWNEVLVAPQPVNGIWSTFSETGSQNLPRKKGHPKDEGVKVDVVADGGKKWIRVNTIKNSRMLAEFRELDSYMTDSDDDDSPEDHSGRAAPPPEFDNSVLRMARSLLNAAKANPIPGTADTPAVVMQLTRLEPSPGDKESDPRIPQTIDELKKMGIDAQLGERHDVILSVVSQSDPETSQKLRPSTRINLDLSILIALVSDLTHSPPPPTFEESDARFTPSVSYVEWKKTRLTATAGDQGDIADVENIAKPSRALSDQAMQETARALFQGVQERLSPAILAGTKIEFWTTPEAIDRCIQIVGKIGGPNERQRAQALFIATLLTVEEQEGLFWRGSRYPRGYVPLFPIRILPPWPESDAMTMPLEPGQGEKGASPGPPSFFAALASTCRAILAQEIMPDPRTLRLSSVSPLPASGTTTPHSGLIATPSDDGEIPRAAVMKANPRLTAHTVQTMLWGALRGWTTLTANKASVKVILREMKNSGNAIWERGGNGNGLGTSRSGEDGGDADGDGSGDVETAALWVVDPRSLAEGMRADLSLSSSTDDSRGGVV